MNTHALGLRCANCGAVLEGDTCCPNGHGYTLQEWNDWARRTWPEHQCSGPDPHEWLGTDR